MTLHHMAYAMSFFREVPVDIFPCSSKFLQLLYQYVGHDPKNTYNPKNLVNAVFVHYYISLINAAIKQNPYLYVATNYFIADCKKNAALNVGSQLKAADGLKFVSDGLFRCISSRSSTLATLGLFIIIQLMNNNDAPVIHELLRSDPVKLIENIRGLFRSKFSHTKYSLRRIFDIFQKDSMQKDSWMEFLLAYYAKNEDILLEDLSADSKSSSCPLYTELVSGVFIKLLEGVRESKNFKNVSFLFAGELFFKMLKKVSEATVIKQPCAICVSIEIYSKIMCEMTHAAFKLKSLSIAKNDEDRKKKKRNPGSFELPITNQDLKKYYTRCY